VTEVQTLEGPLDAERLGWVGGLYGRADPKYGDAAIARHLFEESPAGPALHAFGLDGGRPVAHCAVVPMLGRHGARAIRCGKVEALFVDERFRGRRSGTPPLSRELVSRLYEHSHASGIELLHAYVQPAVGRVLGLDPVEVGEGSLVAVTAPGSLALGRGRQAAGAALGAVQRLLRTPAARLANRGRGAPEARLRPASAEDLDLVQAEPPADGRWTVLAADAWDWYRASPLLRVLEVDGASGSRALVQLPGSPGDPIRIIGWRPAHAGLAPAVLLLAAAARVARRSGAGTLRFQPWPSPAGDGALVRAARLLGFVRRGDFTILYVSAGGAKPAYAEAVVPTPLLYLAF
jgi:hypothetical protein